MLIFHTITPIRPKAKPILKKRNFVNLQWSFIAQTNFWDNFPPVPFSSSTTIPAVETLSGSIWISLHDIALLSYSNGWYFCSFTVAHYWFAHECYFWWINCEEQEPLHDQVRSLNSSLRGESKFEIRTLSVNPTLRFDPLPQELSVNPASWNFEHKKRMQSLASKGWPPTPLASDWR